MADSFHIWILGASGGIGSVLTRLLAGSHRLTVSARNTENLSGLPVVHANCNIGDSDSLHSAFSTATHTHGPVDILVNCAGIGIFNKVTDCSEQDLDLLISTNMKGAMVSTRLVLPAMQARRHGMIIDVNSVASLKAFPNNAGYAATKAGMLAWYRSVREEVREYGVKVVTVFVGATDTGIWPDEPRNMYHDRMLQATDTASVIALLVNTFNNPRMMIEELTVRPQLGDLP